MKVNLYCGIGFLVVLLSTTIAAPNATALNASPSTLTFTAVQGGSNPPAQTVAFSKGNKQQVNWASSDSAAWLSTTPTSGQFTQRDQIVVTVNISGLNAGVYTASVNITAKKGGAVSIPVTLSITGPVSTTPPAPTPSPVTTATLTWSPNAETDLAGFKVYVGNAPGAYGAPIVLGNVTSHIVSNLTLGNTYYFAISAYDTSGNESTLSTVVSKSIY